MITCASPPLDDHLMDTHHPVSESMPDFSNASNQVPQPPQLTAPDPNPIQGAPVPIIDNTPPGRVGRLTSMSTSAALRLEKRAGDDARKCLLTLEDDNCAITIAHIIDRNKLSRREVARLEYIFGLPKDRFHTDTSRNLIYLRSDVHDGLDNGFGWVMLPSMDVMLKVEREFRKVIDRIDLRNDINKQTGGNGDGSFYPTFKDWKVYDWVEDRSDFHVVPLLWNESKPAIVRGNKPYWGGSGFPLVSCWIHPMTALWNAGRKLASLHSRADFSFLLLDPDDIVLLAKAYKIWRMWQGLPLPPAYKDKPSDSPSRASSSKSIDEPRTTRGTTRDDGIREVTTGLSNLKVSLSSKIDNAQSSKGGTRKETAGVVTAKKGTGSSAKSNTSRGDRKGRSREKSS